MNSGEQVDNNLASTKYVSRFLIVISLFLGLAVGVVITSVFNKLTSSTTSSINGVSDSQIYNSQYFDEVYGLLQKEYIGQLPAKEELTYGLVKGLISSLNDPYTYFLNPDEARDYLDSRSPDFEGIGVTLRFNDNNTEVETVLSGYPAERAGMRSDDVVLSVNSESVEGMQPNLVASKIRGDKGSEVKVQVYRPEGAQLLEFTMIRETIEVSNVEAKEVKDGVYQVSIKQFVDESVDAFKSSWDRVVADITKEGTPKAVIVDLRNNPGGYVAGVKHVLEDFLSEGELMMYEENKSTGKTEYRDYRKGKLENVPVVVLVNEGSASASEIFSAAIQDNERGKVVGMPTVGKGVEQQVIDDFPDGAMLIMVFQQWLTPDGRNINKENPIKPDIEIDYTSENATKGVDPQLEKAIEVLN